MRPIKEESPRVLYCSPALSLSPPQDQQVLSWVGWTQATFSNIIDIRTESQCCQLGGEDGDAGGDGWMIQVLGPVGSGSFVRWIDQAIFRATSGKKPR